MSKRFTDTNIWEQSWFIELSPESKNIWQFLEKSCDCAGIWKIDIPEMKRRIGYKNIYLSTFLEEVNRDYNKLTGDPITRNRVMLIANNTKLWLTGFISFQYEKGTNGVNASIPAIKGALNRIKDENIFNYAIENDFLRIAGEDKNSKQENVGNEEKSNLSIMRNDSIKENENCSGDKKEGTIPNIINNYNDGELEKEKVSSLVLINDFNFNSKGCRPSTRDKDKDKDQDLELFGFKDLNTEAEEGSTVHREPDKSEVLLAQRWRKQNILPEERRLVNEFIIKYGFNAVEFAFKEGVKYNKMSLAYVDAICKKRKEKAELTDYRNRDKIKLRESIRLAEEQKKSGQCLTLVKDCYGERSDNKLRMGMGGG